MGAAPARDMGFADRVASGLLVLSLVDGLKNQTGETVQKGQNTLMIKA